MSDGNTEQTFVDPNTDDLDAFDDLLHGRAKELTEVAEQASSEEVETDETDDANTETVTEDVDTEEVDTLEADEEEPEAEPEDETPAPKAKGNRYQERIDELTREKYEHQRRADAIEAKFDELLKKLDSPTPAPQPETKAPEAFTGPKPDETNSDGTEKYPLGEFDPNYIRDLTRHTLAEERAVWEKEQAEKAQLTQAQQEQQKLESAWTDKLNKAKEEKYPDFLEKNQNLQETLGNLDEGYGQYLAETIMNMDFGPDVLYHLASNPTEAKHIASLGPMKATIALGRLEALYATKAEAEKLPVKQPLKVSAAPKPPEVNKGTSVTTTIPDDTDDLDAFERKLFKKR